MPHKIVPEKAIQAKAKRLDEPRRTKYLALVNELGKKHGAYIFFSREDFDRIRTAFPETKPLVRRAASAAVSISTSGLAPMEIRELRRASCESCEAFHPSRISPGHHFCAECSCGDKSWAHLEKKWTMLRVTCPRRRPGFSNAKREENE